MRFDTHCDEACACTNNVVNAADVDRFNREQALICPFRTGVGICGDCPSSFPACDAGTCILTDCAAAPARCPG